MNQKRPYLTLFLPYLLLAVAFFCLLQLEKASFVNKWEPVHDGDYKQWSRNAQHSLLSIDFYTAKRPFTVPLLYKLTNSNENIVIKIQSVFSVIAWFLFAVAICFILDPPLGYLGGILLGFFSLTVPINQWDPVIRSESLSFSLLALLCAATLYFVSSLLLSAPVSKNKKYIHRHPATKIQTVGIFNGDVYILGWGVVTLLFTSARDANTYLVIIIWVFFAFWCAIDYLYGLTGTDHYKRYPIISKALVVLGIVIGMAYLSTTYSSRWYNPLLNVILARVIPNQTTYDYWTKQYKFPRNATLEEYKNKKAWKNTPSGERLFETLPNDSALSTVHSWLITKGVSSYQRYLIWDNLLPSIKQASLALETKINILNKHSGKNAGKTPWTKLLTKLLYPKIPVPLITWGVFTIGSLLLAYFFPAARVIALTTTFFMLGAWTQAFITYHGDAADVARHMHICGILFRLGLWCGVLTCLQTLLRRKLA